MLDKSKEKPQLSSKLFQYVFNIIFANDIYKIISGGGFFFSDLFLILSWVSTTLHHLPIFFLYSILATYRPTSEHAQRCQIVVVSYTILIHFWATHIFITDSHNLENFSQQFDFTHFGSGWSSVSSPSVPFPFFFFWNHHLDMDMDI